MTKCVSQRVLREYGYIRIMNIFYLSHDVVICAQCHVDKHVVKMILEYAQLLSTAHVVLDNNQVGYKKTHVNHPCAIWVRQGIQNYMWLFRLFCALLDEYTYRYGKVHKTSMLIEALSHPPENISLQRFFEPPQAMPDEYKVNKDSVSAYHNYYRYGKTHLHSWKRRNIEVLFK